MGGISSSEAENIYRRMSEKDTKSIEEIKKDLEIYGVKLDNIPADYTNVINEMDNRYKDYLKNQEDNYLNKFQQNTQELENTKNSLNQYYQTMTDLDSKFNEFKNNTNQNVEILSSNLESMNKDYAKYKSDTVSNINAVSSDLQNYKTFSDSNFVRTATFNPIKSSINSFNTEVAKFLQNYKTTAFSTILTPVFIYNDYNSSPGEVLSFTESNNYSPKTTTGNTLIGYNNLFNNYFYSVQGNIAQIEGIIPKIQLSPSSNFQILYIEWGTNNPTFPSGTSQYSPNSNADIFNSNFYNVSFTFDNRLSELTGTYQGGTVLGGGRTKSRIVLRYEGQPGTTSPLIYFKATNRLIGSQLSSLVNYTPPKWSAI